MDFIKIEDLRKNQFLVQSLRYMVTGGASFTADFLVYLIFRQYLNYMAAMYIGRFAGLAVNYIMSKHWVFSNNEPVSVWELLSFILFTAFGFALSGIGMYIGVNLFKADDKLTNIAVAVLVFIINFIARKYIIFRKAE